MSVTYRSAARQFIERRVSGPQWLLDEQIADCDYMRYLIHVRFPDIRRCDQWQVKHVRWVLEIALADVSPRRRYQYYLSVKTFAKAMKRWVGWKRHLRGPWTTPEP